MQGARIIGSFVKSKYLLMKTFVSEVIDTELGVRNPGIRVSNAMAPFVMTIIIFKFTIPNMRSEINEKELSYFDLEIDHTQDIPEDLSFLDPVGIKFH